jgi:hypothetical protein
MLPHIIAAALLMVAICQTAQLQISDFNRLALFQLALMRYMELNND